MTAVELIDQNKAELSVDRLCELLEVSRSWYYKAKRGELGKRARKDAAVASHLRAEFQRYRRRYGSPRLTRALKAMGHHIGRHRVARIMRENGLKARGKRRFFNTTQVDRRQPAAPNLVKRKFTAAAPNRLWVGDMTYVPTLEGWLFLAVLVDVYSRKVVGWATSSSLKSGVALEALNNAIGSRRPPRGLLHHTDRGCQYACSSYRSILKQAGMVQSMSGAGNCLDNAMAESFFATLKSELDQRVFVSRAAAHQAIARYIDGFYNPTRMHSALGFKAPIDFERNPRHIVNQPLPA